jgi:SNF2 family DNA or RNA helicase
MSALSESSFPIGTLVFAKEGENSVDFDNAQIVEYGEDNTMIKVMWLQGKRERWIKNNSSTIYPAEGKRRRGTVDRLLNTMVSQTLDTLDEEGPTNTSRKNKGSENNVIKRSSRPKKEVTPVLIDSDSGDDNESTNSGDDNNDADEVISISEVDEGFSKSKKNSQDFAGISREECDSALDHNFHSMVRHRSALEPFVTPKIFAKLRHYANENNTKKNNTDDAEEIVEQPHSLAKTCVMRPYQIEGLSWLVRQYDSSINSILGDEMGLGELEFVLKLLSLSSFDFC